MPQQDDRRGQMNEALKVFRVIFIAHYQAAKIKQPGEQSLNLPAPHKTAKRTAVLGWRSAILFVGRDHLYAIVLHQLPVQAVTIVRFVSNQSLGHIGHDPFFQGLLHQLYFCWRSTFCPQGERKTMAVCNAHDLGALAPLGLPNQAPPFLAGTNVPSTKHSLRSSPPASLRCCASAKSNCSITPERTQFWKRRCAVWYGPYRGGKSCHGAPVRKIHKIPFNTLRRSLQGRPRPSSRTGLPAGWFRLLAIARLLSPSITT